MRLCDELKKYGDSDFYPFHMPGHKRNSDFLNELYASDGKLVDITEIEGFDNLHNAQGILEEEQKRAAKIFGSKEAFFLVNGSTCGILSAIASTVSLGEKVIVAKNCHKSVYNGIKLRNADVVYITPEERSYQDYSLKLTGAILPEDVKNTLSKNKDAKALIITSPTYEGISSDVEKIADICHDAKVPLIVDAAHGAHFGFYDAFPKSAIECGADIVITSLHKTLPALTSTALLLTNTDLVDITKIQYYLQVFQTSSPSYVLMSSISSCLKYLESDKSKVDFKNYVNLLLDFYQKAEHVLPAQDRDISKIIIAPSSINAQNLTDYMRKEHHIELEMTQPTYALALTSVCDTKEGFDRLLTALNMAPGTKENKKNANNQTFDRNWIGKKSPVMIVPYPPGIPLVQKDELIKKEHADKIELLISEGIQIEGLNLLTNC